MSKDSQKNINWSPDTRQQMEFARKFKAREAENNINKIAREAERPGLDGIATWHGIMNNIHTGGEG